MPDATKEKEEYYKVLLAHGVGKIEKDAWRKVIVKEYGEGHAIVKKFDSKN
jgi:hypothetical protein